MTTLRKLITGSMRLIRVVGANETPTDEDMSISIKALGGMLDSMQTDLLNIYYTPYKRFLLKAGQAEYTLGPAVDSEGKPTGADWVVDRPIRVERAVLLQFAGINGASPPAPPPPVANFEGVPTSGNNPLNVQFTDLSTGNPTSWLWDFKNDGSATSTTQNPSYTYPNVGTYTVKLTASNAGGSDAEIKTDYITVTAAPPPPPNPPNFVAVTDNGAARVMTSDNGTTWTERTAPPGNWELVTAGGNYFVALGNRQTEADNYVMYSSDRGVTWTPGAMPPPAPGDTKQWEALVYGQGVFLAFTGNQIYRSEDNGATWEANTTEGDGWTLAAYRHPTGDFLALNTITGDTMVSINGGVDWLIYDNPIPLEPGEVWLSLAAGAGQFTASTSFYRIFRLIAQTGWVPIDPQPAYYAPITELIYANGRWVGLSDTTIIESVDGQNWYYTEPPVVFAREIAGGNNIFPVATNNEYESGYFMTGTATQNGLMQWQPLPSITREWKDIAYPTPVVDFVASPYKGSAPLEVTFTNYSTITPTSWLWDFKNDGTATSTLENPTYTYTEAGNYTVKLTAVDGPSSISTTKNFIITVLPEAPVAEFSAAPTSGTWPLEVTFTDESLNDPTQWQWDFTNDGGTDSTSQNPTYTYTEPGTYSVKLRVINDGGESTITKTDLITVSEIPAQDYTFQIRSANMQYRSVYEADIGTITNWPDCAWTTDPGESNLYQTGSMFIGDNRFIVMPNPNDAGSAFSIFTSLTNTTKRYAAEFVIGTPPESAEPTLYTLALTVGYYGWSFQSFNINANFPLGNNPSYPAYYSSTGTIKGYVGSPITAPTFTTGDVIGVTYAAQNNFVRFYKNGTFLGQVQAHSAQGYLMCGFQRVNIPQYVWANASDGLGYIYNSAAAAAAAGVAYFNANAGPNTSYTLGTIFYGPPVPWGPNPGQEWPNPASYIAKVYINNVFQYDTYQPLNKQLVTP